MSVFLRFLTPLLLFVFSLTAQSQTTQPLVFGSEHKIASQVLKEEREYLVSLPQSYEDDEIYRRKRYPVLILLDADTHFRYASSMIQFLSAGETEQIPELIVVGVRNTDRTRDMTSGLPSEPHSFLSFLENELLPQIDRQYRTLPYRVLVGHSLAGLFTVNTLLEQRAFQAYIAIDPTLSWNKASIVQKARSVFESNTSLKARFYLTQAGNPLEPGPPSGVRGKAFQEFVVGLTTNRSKKLFQKHVYYPQENHFSVPLRSLYDGLLFVFNDYEFPFATFHSEGVKGIKNHYQKLSTQLEVSLLPPGKVINQIGLYLLHNQNQADKAIDLLSLNADYYPDSPDVFSYLADAYKAKGDKVRAIESYQKVLRLQVNHGKAQKALDELTKQQD